MSDKQSENSYTPLPPIPDEEKEEIKLEAIATCKDIYRTFYPLSDANKVEAFETAYIALFRVKEELIWKIKQRAKNAYNEMVDAYTVQIEELTADVENLKNQIK